MDKHGLSGTNIYYIWTAMKQRCRNPMNKNYNHYGGRGIKVCDRWLDFENFFKDMGCKPEGMSLDRENNDGDYSPENCRWATKAQQVNNKRTNVLIRYKGQDKLLGEWCGELGININTVKTRINMLGWSIEDAFEKPVRKLRR